MQKQNEVKLGALAPSGSGRDAIHIAVVPVTSSDFLMPGQHVGLVAGATDKVSARPPFIGIVDPFLPRDTGVVAGRSFWLCLYPYTITSLKHLWTHPAFGEETVKPRTRKTESEEWMREWAVRHMGYDYYSDPESHLSEDMAYAKAIQAGHDLSVGPYEDARDHIDGTWWDHWETITGEDGQRGEYFSCGC